MRTSVVVTGLGVLGPAGIGCASLAELLARGEVRCVELEPQGHLSEAVRLAARLPEFDSTPWIAPRKARRMSRPSRMAVVATRLACEDAGIVRAGANDAVCLATAFGPTAHTEKILQTIAAEGPEAVSPFHFSECVANVGAAQVAIDQGVRGPNLTITAREAGPALVMDAAVRMLRAGRATRVYALCVDEISPLTHAILDRMRAVTRRADACPQPFGVARDGVLASEGATAVVLETEATARARGAKVLAHVRATVALFDPTAGPRDWGRDPAGLADRLRAGLRRFDMEPAAIDLIIASAAGSRLGDAYEAALWHELYDADLPPVVAPKAHLGEWGGGHLGAALLALGGASIARPAGDADPALALTATGTNGVRPRRILLSALAVGGAAAFVVLETPA